MSTITAAQFDDIKGRVQGADLEGLDALQKNGDTVPGPSEIAEGLVSGSIEPEEVDEMLLRWVAESVDIPYVPDALERRALEVVVQALEGVVMSLLRRYVA